MQVWFRLRNGSRKPRNTWWNQEADAAIESLWRAIINIFVHSVYLYDDHFTLIINASKKPLHEDNIPLDDIEGAFEGVENKGAEGCSNMTPPAPPKN